MLVTKKECIGCSNCKNICPKNAIEMVFDDEKFLYPKINSSLCIKCKLCETKCPIISFNKLQSQDHNIKVYSGYNTSNEELLKSASGGAAFLISKKFIENNGYVAGVIYDESFTYSKYLVTNKLEELQLLQSSKYIQSRKEDTFIKISQLINKKNKVLFIGTPCDVAALKVFLGNKNIDEYLFTIDIICHGPTSELVHNTYLKEKNFDDIIYLNVRDKTVAWEKPTLLVKTKDKEFKEPFYSSNYGYGFLTFTRPSCFNCKFKDKNHYADLTLGDFWGLKNNHENYNSNGVSVIFLHTERGLELLNNLQGFSIKETDYEFAVNGNQNYIKVRKKPYNREIFKRKLLKKGLQYACLHSETKLHKVKLKAKKVIKKILRKK